MLEPRFEIGQEVAQNCAHGQELDGLRHPVLIKAVIPYGDESTYRIEGANGRHYEVKSAVSARMPVTRQVAYSWQRVA